MDQPLVSTQDEESHPLQRSGSLLDRIRAQRERETISESDYAAPNYNANNNDTANHEAAGGNPVQVPNYTPIAQDAMGGGGDGGAGPMPWGSSSFGFPSFSMPHFGGGGGGRNNIPAANDSSSQQQRLLSDPAVRLSPNYTMSEYFYMFVMDVYTMFRSLPILAQALLVVVLLWVAWKLL